MRLGRFIDRCENTVQQNQSPAVAIFRVAELNRTSLQSLVEMENEGSIPYARIAQ
jgi:hypothetical protein